MNYEYEAGGEQYNVRDKMMAENVLCRMRSIDNQRPHIGTPRNEPRFPSILRYFAWKRISFSSIFAGLILGLLSCKVYRMILASQAHFLCAL